MKTKKYIFAILTLLWVVAIFSFSMQPAEVSDGMSISFLQKVVKLFAPGMLDELETLPKEQLFFWNFFIRKCAHFAEYFILGVLSTVTLLNIDLRRKLVYGIGFCFAVAGIDEFIQLFVSGRSGKVQDVLLDSVGAVVGIMMVMFVVKWISKKVRRGEI